MLWRYIGRFRGFDRDARLFLLASVGIGSALSLYWVDFNLYLRSLGHSDSLIGAVGAGSAAAMMFVAFPASMLSDRVGRRTVMIGGSVLVLASAVALLLTREIVAIFVCAAAFSAGNQALQIVSAPFLTEHSRPDQRSELFSAQFAISSGTQMAAALLGGLIAQQVAAAIGVSPDSADAYRTILVLMAGLAGAGVLALLLLRSDRPDRRTAAGAREPAGSPRSARAASTDPIEDPSSVPPSSGAQAPAGGAAERRPAPARGAGTSRTRMARLLFPGFLISLGAGQVIPFLNLFVSWKFGLELASINALFAITSLGTLVATLIQPALASRFGKMGSVVLVQATSIPFLVVLGFSPFFWTVAVAMAVRNSLMNAGNPVFTAFAMEHVQPEERATYSAANSLLWALGWTVAQPWYSVLHGILGPGEAYLVNFVSIIALYTVGTALYWLWFGRAERAERLSAGGALPAGA